MDVAMEEATLIRGELPDWAASGYGSGGYGYGSGGYGYGSGCDGYGSGCDGSGSGSGSGSDSPAYWLASIPYLLTSEQRDRLAELQRSDATIAFWRSDANGHPSNGGGQTEPARAGLRQEIAGPLEICTARALHATALPYKWKGSRLWVVALLGETQYQADGEKYAALKRELIGEVTEAWAKWTEA